MRKYLLMALVLVAIVSTIGACSSNGTTPNSSFNNDNQDLSLLKTDKSIENSEIIGNLYRNTKYHFRIKFPEGWKIAVGDGINIVQKASLGNGTISVLVMQFDFKGSKGFSSIKDFGSRKEFIDASIEGAREKFSDVKIINYGETKIDNEPAYWVEYSASAQVLDYHITMTNLSYSIAKGDTMYTIAAGTISDEYVKMKPLFTQSVSTFVLENY